MLHSKEKLTYYEDSYFGYLFQALANSIVTNVAIYNWIITGLLLFTADKKPLKTLNVK